MKESGLLMSQDGVTFDTYMRDYAIESRDLGDGDLLWEPRGIEFMFNFRNVLIVH